jgi:crotonobetainyl-CoA:carnitine CoA-transferase CaiB-like acyl-CoA transferase
MNDAMLLFSETVIANYSYGEKELEPRGQHHPNLMPFGIFPTSDGAVAIAALNPNHWSILCAAMGRADLIDDERSKNVYKRKTNQVFVEAQISAWTSSVSKAEIVAALGGVVPCGPVNTASDIYNDPHVVIREMITRFQLPGDNPEVSIAGSPIKYTKTKTGFYQRPPLLGEHTDEILDEFNLSRKK